MRARQDDELEEFVAARTQDLHHAAYLLTAAQDDAEHLVAVVLAELSRERIDLSQAAFTARQRMARAAARADVRAPDIDHVPSRFRPLAALTSRQRAILLLDALDGHDLHSAARALQLSPRQVEESYAAIPSALTDINPAELRRLLEDFGDLAESADPATTLTEMHSVPPPPRRPWWSYAAAALVVVLTVSSVWITQTWHHEWLRTATGLNHTHGTHYPAYTQGYQLIDIRDVAPGPATTLHLRAQDAVVIGCAKGQADQTTIARVASGISGLFMLSCSTVGGRQHLTPVIGDTVLAIDDFTRTRWPVGVYRKVSWDEYPVAQSDFTVQHNETLASQHPTDNHGDPIQPAVRGQALTLHGTAAQPNGTFRGTLKVPATPAGTQLDFTGLLSPTTTGQFSLLVDHGYPWTLCGIPDQALYMGRENFRTCSLMDHQVPQVRFGPPDKPVTGGTSIPVTFTVKHALGPWTLQLVYNSYRTDNEGQFIGP